MSTPARVNPFPGLRPFREDEEHLFFGRENQVDTLVDTLAATRFLAVVGTSGCGKSSLVNSGLRPALHRGLMATGGTRWSMVQFRPGGDPIRAMARALVAEKGLFEDPGLKVVSLLEIVEVTLRMSKLGLVDIFAQARLPAGSQLLVIVDQFEELFRYRKTEGGGPDRAQDAVAFVNLLLEARAQPSGPIHIVLTMRSDFLGDCAQLPGLAEAINTGQYPGAPPHAGGATRGDCWSSQGRRRRHRSGLSDATGERRRRQPRSAFDPAARVEPHLGAMVPRQSRSAVAIPL